MKAERAVPEDIEELVNIRLAYLAEDSGEPDEQTKTQIRNMLPDYFRRHLGKDLTAYVIRSDSKIVSSAFLLLCEKPMSPSFINGKTAIVLNVYTYPEYRRRGYAAVLIRQMLADAEEMELSVIELKSTDAGHELYRSAGFADDHSKYHLMKWKRSPEE